MVTAAVTSMEFSLSPTFSERLTPLIEPVARLSDQLSTFLKDKQYGDDIHHLCIGLLCVPEQNLSYHLPLRHRYIHERKTYRKGEYTFDFYRALEYGLVLDYQVLRERDAETSIGLIREELIKSFGDIRTFSKKIRDFDERRFQTDMMNFVGTPKAL
jgi:hypothetical protein